MTAYERLLERAGDAVVRAGKVNSDVRCPAHDDREPSLSVAGREGKAVVKCHAGCRTEDVMAAWNLPMAALFDSHWNGNGRGGDIEAVYPYFDERGGVLFEVVRFPGKRFRQRAPSGEWNVKGIRRVLYRLPNVITAITSGDTIYVVEGEKDVHAVEQAGAVATCNPAGAGKWKSEYSEMLRGANAVVVADRDDRGREHAAEVARKLAGIAASVRIVEPVEGKDASDHLAAGHGLDELQPTGEPVEVIDPAEVIDTAELLDEIGVFITRYVVLPSVEVRDLLALWVLHTHAVDAAFATPYLRIVSPAPASGRSLLLEVLDAITRNGWYVVAPSVAVLYRYVDRYRPTLLLDEFDNYPLDDRTEALSIFNAGYKRGAKVDRCTQSGELERFDCFCPKAYAGLDRRRTADTLLSRSITIRLDAKLPHDDVQMWIAPLAGPEAHALRDRCRAWAAQLDTDELRRRRPELPACLQSRGAEVWWALLVIAEQAGGDWPARAHRAAYVLTTGGDERDEQAETTQLFSDIRDVFGDAETIFSRDLLAALNALDESPWGARWRGEGLDARGTRPVAAAVRHQDEDGAGARSRRDGEGLPR